MPIDDDDGANQVHGQKIRLTKAYANQEFLNSPDGRSLRILSEFLEPQGRLRRHDVVNTIVFFGSARSISAEEAGDELDRLRSQDLDPDKVRHGEERIDLGQRTAKYYHSARELARRLTEWSKSRSDNPRNRFYVCSGGGPGIMEAANRGASDANGVSIGLNISLPFEPNANPYQTRELSFEFHYFFMRKFWFFYPARALIVFPGGFGTLDELFEVLNLITTKKTTKQLPVVLFGSEFWNDVVNFDALERWGVVSPSARQLFRVFDSVDDAFEYTTARLGQLYPV